MAQITSNILTAPPLPVARPGGRDSGGIACSPELAAAARKDAAVVLAELGTSAGGLTLAEARRRLIAHGPNEVAQEKQHGWPWRLLRRSATRW